MVNYKNSNNFDIEHHNKDTQNDNEKPNDSIKDQECANPFNEQVIKYLKFSSLQESDDDENESNHDTTIQNEHLENLEGDLENETKTDICSRKNQWYAYSYNIS